MSNMYKLDIIQIIMCSTNITGIGMCLPNIIKKNLTQSRLPIILGPVYNGGCIHENGGCIHEIFTKKCTIGCIHENTMLSIFLRNVEICEIV